MPLTITRPEFLGGGSWTVGDMGKCAVVLGKNGAGKSKLLRGIRDQSSESRHYVIPERSGEIQFNANYITEIDNHERLKNRTSSNYSDNYRSLTITRVQFYYTVRGTKKSSTEDSAPNSFFQLLQEIIPEFNVKIKTSNPYYELTRISDGQAVASVEHLSSGESQLFTMGLDILMTVAIWKINETSDCILLIDEPDAHIHPDLQIRFAKFLKKISDLYDQVKIIVATHSMTLVSAICKEFDTQSSVATMARGQSTITFRTITKIQEEIFTILGGHILMGFMFQHPIILVEGDDEYQMWSHISRGSNRNICILPCNGDEIRRYHLTLERTLTAISDAPREIGFTLLDGDKPLPQATPDHPQNYVKYIRLNCRESENLYLADEVIRDMGYADWACAVAKIKSEADKYGAKADAMRRVEAMDRSKDDFKPIINELASVLDSKNLRWTVRLGKYIAKTQPTGMLANFLGIDVVRTLQC